MSRALDRTGRFLCSVYVAGIGLPLFILPEYRTTNWTLIFHPQAPASLDRQPLRVHWIVGLGALVALYWAVRWAVDRGVARPPRALPVAILGLVFLLALMTGLATGAPRLSAVYFVQTIAPLLGFFVGTSVASRITELRRSLHLFVATVTVSLACILVLAGSYGVFSGDVEAANRLNKAIPQLRDYFPLVVAVSMSLALGLRYSARRRGERIALLCAIGIHLLSYSLAWSRMGLVLLAVVLVMPLTLSVPSVNRRQWFGRVAWTIVLLTATALLVSQVSVLKERLRYPIANDNATDRSDAKRIRYAVEASKLIAEAPLFGRQFEPEWTMRVTGSREEPLRIPRVYMAHNQYLDYGIRAGVPAMFVLAVIFVVVVKDTRDLLELSRTLRGLRPVVVAIAGGLVAVAVGNLTQVHLVQAQTGSLAWLLVGFTTRLADTARHDGASRLAQHGPV